MKVYYGEQQPWEYSNDHDHHGHGSKPSVTLLFRLYSL